MGGADDGDSRRCDWGSWADGRLGREGGCGRAEAAALGLKGSGSVSTAADADGEGAMIVGQCGSADGNRGWMPIV